MLDQHNLQKEIAKKAHLWCSQGKSIWDQILWNDLFDMTYGSQKRRCYEKAWNDFEGLRITKYMKKWQRYSVYSGNHPKFFYNHELWEGIQLVICNNKYLESKKYHLIRVQMDNELQKPQNLTFSSHDKEYIWFQLFDFIYSPSYREKYTQNWDYLLDKQGLRGLTIVNAVARLYK